MFHGSSLCEQKKKNNQNNTQKNHQNTEQMYHISKKEKRMFWFPLPKNKNGSDEQEKEF